MNLSDRERRLQRILTLERELKQEMNTLYDGSDEPNAYYTGNHRLPQSAPSSSSYPMDHYGRRSPQQRKEYDHYSRSSAAPLSLSGAGMAAPRRDFNRPSSPRQRPQVDSMQARPPYGNRFSGGYADLGGRPSTESW